MLIPSADLKTAQTQGITFAPTLLILADEVIWQAAHMCKKNGRFQKCLATRQLILQSGLLKGVPGSKPYSSYPDCPLKLARQDVCQIGIMV